VSQFAGLAAALFSALLGHGTDRLGLWGPPRPMVVVALMVSLFLLKHPIETLIMLLFNLMVLSSHLHEVNKNYEKNQGYLELKTGF